MIAIRAAWDGEHWIGLWDWNVSSLTDARWGWIETR